MEKRKVFIPVEKGVITDLFVTSTSTHYEPVKEQEGYFFTAEELIEMRMQDYLNGFHQRNVYIDEIQTPDQYIESLNI